MKRICILLLALLLCLFSLCASAEAARHTTAYDFDLRLHLNPDSFPAARRTRLQGYADLLEALSFRGSLLYDPETENLDFSLELVPDDRGASPVSFRFFGPPDAVMMSSSLFGSSNVVFSNKSLVEFAVKMHEHLGLNLHYGALLVPYVYEYAFYDVIQRWNKYIYGKTGTRTVSAKKIQNFAEALDFALAYSKGADAILRALCLSGEDEELIRGEVYGLSSYLLETVTAGKKLAIKMEPGSEVWLADGKPVYTRLTDPAGERISTDLPLTPGGYQPAFSLTRAMNNGREDLQLHAGWTRNGEDDLLDFCFAGAGLPAAWPADAEASGEVALRGMVYPGFAFGWSLAAASSGHAELQIKTPSGEKAGEVLLRAEGTVLPREAEVPVFLREEIDACVDILRMNDVTLAAFKNSVMPTAITGMIRFLAGIPASSCQSLLDDLTDLGILDLLLAE